MTAPSFLSLMVVLILGYLAVLAYTGATNPDEIAGGTNQNFGTNLGHLRSAHQHGPVPFEMSETAMADIASRLGPPGPISLNAIGGEKSKKAVALLANFLGNKGFTITISWIGVLAPPLDQPIELRANGVYVDASK